MSQNDLLAPVCKQGGAICIPRSEFSVLITLLRNDIYHNMHWRFHVHISGIMTVQMHNLYTLSILVSTWQMFLSQTISYSTTTSPLQAAVLLK